MAAISISQFEIYFATLLYINYNIFCILFYWTKKKQKNEFNNKYGWI